MSLPQNILDLLQIADDAKSASDAATATVATAQQKADDAAYKNQLDWWPL